MPPVRRVVIDVLKPHDPSLLHFTDVLAEVESVEGVTGTVLERDEDVQNVSVTIEGEALEYEAIEDAVETLGGTVHSVDQVSAGERVVERRRLPQDR